MAALTLKKLLGDAGAGMDQSHGSNRLYDVLKQLVSDMQAARQTVVSAYLETIATGIIATRHAPKAGFLKKFTTTINVCGSSGNTTVRVLKNGAAVASLDLTTANTDPDPTTKTVDLGAAAVAVAAGDLIQIQISAAAGSATGLSATLVIEPDMNTLTVE